MNDLTLGLFQRKGKIHYKKHLMLFYSYVSYEFICFFSFIYFSFINFNFSIFISSGKKSNNNYLNYMLGERQSPDQPSPLESTHILHIDRQEMLSLVISVYQYSELLAKAISQSNGLFQPHKIFFFIVHRGSIEAQKSSTYGFTLLMKWKSLQRFFWPRILSVKLMELIN